MLLEPRELLQKLVWLDVCWKESLVLLITMAIGYFSSHRIIESLHMQAVTLWAAVELSSNIKSLLFSLLNVALQ